MSGASACTCASTHDDYDHLYRSNNRQRTASQRDWWCSWGPSTCHMDKAGFVQETAVLISQSSQNSKGSLAFLFPGFSRMQMYTQGESCIWSWHNWQPTMHLMVGVYDIRPTSSPPPPTQHYIETCSKLPATFAPFHVLSLWVSTPTISLSTPFLHLMVLMWEKK